MNIIAKMTVKPNAEKIAVTSQNRKTTLPGNAAKKKSNMAIKASMVYLPLDPP